jgi:GNAT superfamily N-acetyltransferase
VIVRDATPADAEAACEVLRASIIQLCVPDHRGDPDVLARWLANKTSENLKTWIADPNTSVLLVIENEDVLAVGQVRDEGEITLNYVSPQARFRGASTALINAMEIRAGARGATRCHLASTETAHRFYLARGYADIGTSESMFGTSAC